MKNISGSLKHFKIVSYKRLQGETVAAMPSK